jgi:hypothetical protein
VTLPAPAPGITARVATVRVGKKRKWVIEVFAADTGVKKAQLASPFPKPTFSAIEVDVVDGAGSPEQVLLAGKKRKKVVTVVLPV